MIEKGLEKRDPKQAKKALAEVEAAFKKVAEKHKELGLRVLVFPPIAVDLLPKKVSKAKGTDKIIKKLPKARQYFAFGDARTDLEMVRPLARQKKDYYFVFVGEIDRFRKARKTKTIPKRRVVSVSTVVKIFEKKGKKFYRIKPEKGPHAIKSVLKWIKKEEGKWKRRRPGK